MYLVDSYIFSNSFARIVDSTGIDLGRSVTTDSNGGVYVAGRYNGTPNVKTASGTVLATLPTSVNVAAFVSKFDSSGAYQYSVIVDGTSSTQDYGYGVTSDNMSNIYLACDYTASCNIIFASSSNTFSNVASLPPMVGSTPQACMVKFTSSGTYLYSRIIDSTSSSDCYGVACDTTGNVYMTGNYDGSSVYVRTASNANVYSNVATLPASFGFPTTPAAYVSKFTSTGTYLYSRLVDSTSVSGNDTGYAVACDASDNLYIAGTYRTDGYIRTASNSNVYSNVSILPTSIGFVSSFLLKFDAGGAYQYGRTIDSARQEYGYSVSCDPQGNVYFAGEYSGNTTTFVRTSSSTNVYANVATLPIVLTGTSNAAAFVSKFDSSGAYQYSRIIDSIGNQDTGFSVACDPMGNVYLAGSYTTGPAYVRTASNANVFSNVTTIAAVTRVSAFVAKFNSSGTYQYARIVGTSISSEDTTAYGVCCDSNSNMYITGGYLGTPTIKDQAGTTIGTLPTSSGNDAAFLIKFSPDGTYAS